MYQLQGYSQFASRIPATGAFQLGLYLNRLILDEWQTDFLSTPSPRLRFTALAVPIVISYISLYSFVLNKYSNYVTQLMNFYGEHTYKRPNTKILYIGSFCCPLCSPLSATKSCHDYKDADELVIESSYNEIFELGSK